LGRVEQGNDNVAWVVGEWRKDQFVATARRDVEIDHRGVDVRCRHIEIDRDEALGDAAIGKDDIGKSPGDRRRRGQVHRGEGQNRSPQHREPPTCAEPARS
jgi:hypothetical protein